MVTQKPDYHQYMASREWRLKRKGVIERQDNICLRCGAASIHNVHHVTYERLGNETPEDLIGLCRPCHEYVSGERDADPAVIVVLELIRTVGIHPEFRDIEDTWPYFLWWRTGPTKLGVSFCLDLTAHATPDPEMIEINNQIISIRLPGAPCYAHCWWM